MTEAEAEWLEAWTAGPTEPEGLGLSKGSEAPDLVMLADHTQEKRQLFEFRADRVVLRMFWRHFGCSCGVDRAKRLLDEYAAYEAAGVLSVIITQGEPTRAAAHRDRHGLPCPVLCDPGRQAYRDRGVGQWSVERLLFDAPEEFWAHPHDLGADLSRGNCDCPLAGSRRVRDRHRLRRGRSTSVPLPAL